MRTSPSPSVERLTVSAGGHLPDEARSPAEGSEDEPELPRIPVPQALPPPGVDPARWKRTLSRLYSKHSREEEGYAAERAWTQRRFPPIGHMRHGVVVPRSGYTEQRAHDLGRTLTGLVRHGFDYGPVNLKVVADYFEGTVSEHLLLLAIRESGVRRDGQQRLVAVPTVGTGTVVRASRSLPR